MVRPRTNQRARGGRGPDRGDHRQGWPGRHRGRRQRRDRLRRRPRPGVRHPGAAVSPVELAAEARPVAPGRVARGSAPGRRSRHGQGLASPRLHVCRRSLVRRPADDRLRQGDDRRGGTVRLPRDRAGQPRARGQAARGPAGHGRGPELAGGERGPAPTRWWSRSARP